jgi:hypothetical protein
MGKRVRKGGRGEGGNSRTGRER